MIIEQFPALKDLSFDQKVTLIEELWQDAVARAGLREDHLLLLEERLRHFEENPSSTRSWEDVRESILSSR